MATAVGSCVFEEADAQQVSAAAQRWQVNIPITLSKFMRFGPTDPVHRHGGR